MAYRPRSHTFFRFCVKFSVLVENSIIMTSPHGLSSRMTGIVAAVLPRIAVTVAERSSAQLPKIDLATAENWLVRDELVGIYKEAFARDVTEDVIIPIPLPKFLTRICWPTPSGMPR